MGIEIWAKRDDQLDEVAAGNKLRKGRRELDRLPAGTTGIVSVGGTGSNHLRTLALLARQRGLQMHAIVHDSHGDRHGNLLVLRLAGVSTSFCEPNEIKGTVEAVLKARGPGWHFVPGGGHNLNGLLAYSEAIDELAEQQVASRLANFDAIVLASGTGTTQAGLIHGTHRHGWATRVIGISVARDSDRGSAAVREALAWSGCPSPSVEFDDRFRAGGYGALDDRVLDVIKDVLTLEGLPLDPTYTGKAMLGLTHLATEQELPLGGRVLFWHTGGLINLLSEFPSIGGQA